MGVIAAGFVYLAVSALMASRIERDTLQHGWIDHLLFVENGSAIESFRLLEQLPAFTSPDDIAFIVSVLAAFGVFLLTLGALLVAGGGTLLMNRMIHLGAIPLAYIFAIQIADAVSGTNGRAWNAPDASLLVVLYILAAFYLSETLKSVTTLRFFSANHLEGPINGLFALALTAILMLRYPAELVAVFGSIVFLLWLAFWLYLFDFLKRAMLSMLLSFARIEPEVDARRTELGQSSALLALIIRLWWREMQRLIVSVDLFEQFDAFLSNLRQATENDDELSAGLERGLGVFAFCLNLAWFTVLPFGAAVAYWWVYRAPS